MNLKKNKKRFWYLILLYTRPILKLKIKILKKTNYDKSIYSLANLLTKQELRIYNMNNLTLYSILYIYFVLQVIQKQLILILFIKI